MTLNPDSEPGHVPGQLGLLPEHLTPAALEDARAHAQAELERLDLAATQARAEVLDRMRRCSQMIEHETRQRDVAVTEARGLGATWQQIADAVGMTRQSAWERWSR